MDDLYLVLGIEPDANPEMLQERFRFLAQAYHPDKFASPKQKLLAEEEFKKINNAYQVLSNPIKRADYDKQRKYSINYSNRNRSDTLKKAEEAARQRAQEELKRKAEEAARQRAREELKRKAEEAARQRAQEELKGKADQAAHQRVRAVSKSKIVAIHSFKSGTGKSFTTANLAAQVAQTGKRVGVVDVDFQSPGLGSYFGFDEKNSGKTMNDYLQGKATVGEIAFPVGNNGDGTKALSGNMWLFPASSRGVNIHLMTNQGVDFNRLNAGLQNIIIEFELDYLFIDTQSGLGEDSLLAVATSDILLIIFRPDSQDVQHAFATLSLAQALEVPSIFLVVNKALPKDDPSQIKKDIEADFNARVAGVLPLFLDMVDDARSYLFSFRYPDHEWSKGLRAVAEIISTAS
ncbi:MAG: DnaJ domain-containing protein [Chloroflexi bacterium]|nr:DnaJ domain-containing protein [Chloroflexota bacterium]